MELLVPLLGWVNVDVSATAPLRPKYIVKVTAEIISTHLTYERRGKQVGAPFKLLPASLIKIDKDIQRGTDEQGFISQQPVKVREIQQTLLGTDAVTVPRLYLGSLVWNVRPPSELDVVTISQEGKPPSYRLRLVTEGIYLTDSAHRHLGIAEAYRAYVKEPAKYPKFRKDFEFVIELYNLDKSGEKELFNELNSKQKRISAAKQKELDVSSPIGGLKDAILEQDIQSHKRLFDNNIEVASNQNDKHTLMTMSVFVASIGEMFDNAEIKTTRDEVELRTEMAEYYCEYSNKLADTLIVRCDIDGDGRDEDVHPFSNLWLSLIKPVEDSDENQDTLEKRLEGARQIAVDRNRNFRKRDIANHNAVVKALYRLGGAIRRMPRWAAVIDRLQNDLNASADGKFFQKSNPDWFDKASESDIPIASLNQDESMNVQVQSKNIDKIYSYLFKKLDLQREVALLRQDGTIWIPFHSAQVSQGSPTPIRLRVQVTSPLEPSETLTTVAIKPSIDWKGGTLTGQKKLLPAEIKQDSSYVDQFYDDLKRWNITFELQLPSVPQLEEFNLVVIVEYALLGGALEKKDFYIRVFPTA